MAEGGKGAFDSLNESYENFVLTLEEKGVPSPRILIPVIGAIILIAIALFLAPGLLNPTTTVELKVLNAQGAPVAGADVILTAGEDQFTARSLSDGSVSFENVPQRSDYDVQVSALGYQAKTALVASGEEIRLSGTTSSQKKTLKIKVVGSDRITTVDQAAVVLSFDDGNKMDKYTDDWGEAVFDLTGLENKIATAEISKEGFESKTKTVSVNDGVITIDLIETHEGNTNDATYGDFIVSVGGAQAEGVVISLVDPYTQSSFSNARIDASNKALFPRMKFNTHFIVSASDPDERFLNYDGDELVFESNLQEEIIILQPKQSSQDEMVITVKDKGGIRISGAEVKIYDKTTRTLYGEDSTDSNGNVKFSVASKSYYVTSFKEGFLPGFIETARRGDAKTMELEAEADGNFVEASTLVTANGGPVPDAEVNIFKSNGFPLGIPSIFTSADGNAVFNLPLFLDGKTYKAYAVASSGNKIGRSDLVDAAEGTDFIIAIQAPPANITLVGKNLLTKEVIPNTLFSVITPGEAILKDCASPCSVLLPSEVEFRIVASASNYLQTTTVPIAFQPGERKTVEILMYPLSLSKKNSVNFIGFFDRNGNAVNELQRAETYKAKFMVSLGEKSDAFAFFQAGESADAIAEPFDVIGFKSAVKTTKILVGENAENVCSPEEQPETESIKWIELAYTNQLGAGEVSFDFRVKPDAAPGSEVKIIYRMGGVVSASGIPFTSPQDDDLINQLLSQGSRDREVFCNAQTSFASTLVQNNAMTCKEGLCSRIILEREDGFKSSNNLPVAIGKQFKLNFDLFAPDQSIDSVALEESPAFEIISGNAGEAHFADRTFTATGTDKTSGSISMRAVKPTVRSVLRFKVSFASEKPPITIEKSIEVTGSGQFQVSFNPKQSILGESVRGEAIIIDGLSRPVTNAEVSLYNCEDSRKVISETKTILGRNVPGEGRDGRYEFRFAPETIGQLCVEARAEGFETESIEAMTVNAEDFLSLDKEQIAFTGPVDQIVPIPVEVKSALQGTKIKIQGTANSECALLLSVIPSVKEKVEESAQFNIRLNSFDVIDADCVIIFQGEANPLTKATVLLPVSIHTTAGTPGEGQRCDSSCLTASEAQGLGCSPRNSFVCTESGKSCFVCGNGLDGINAISLSVSNLKNDRKVYPLVLTFEPQFNEEFDLVWEQPFNTRINPVSNSPQFQYQQSFGNYPQAGAMPYDNYMQQQGVNPYYSSNYPLGIGQGYSQYQYLPEYQNPIRTGVPPELLGTQYPYQTQGSYGYSQSQLAIPQQYQMQQGFGQNCMIGAQNTCPQGFICSTPGIAGGSGTCIPTGGPYPGLQPNQPVVPPYCYNYVFNQQSSYNYQFQQQNQFSAYTPSQPFGNPSQCQYPYVCQNPQACGFIAGGGPTQFGNMPPECQYPAVCNNPSACRMFSGAGQPQVQNRETGSPVRVSFELTKTQLTVSAVYTGDQYFFAGGQPATARGYLIVRDERGVEKKRISFTVEVSYSGSIQVQQQQPAFNQPAFIPPQQSNRIPPECMALFYPQTQGGQQGQFALPQNMLVLTNAYTGKGQAEYPFEPPRTGKVTCQTQTTISDVTCTTSEIKEMAEVAQGTKIVKKEVTKPVVVLSAKASKTRKEAQGKASFIWSLQTANKLEQDFAVRPDDFKPQKIQLLRFLENPDKAEFDVEIKKENCEFKGDYAKISCDGNLTAETTGLKFGQGASLIVKGLNNQYREIPVAVSNVIHPNLKVEANGRGSMKITFNPKLDFPKEGVSSLQVSESPEYIDDGTKGACNTVNAQLENNEIVVEADCTNFVKEGKVQPFVSHYIVKLILPENAGDRSFTIPFLVTDKPIQYDFSIPIIIAPPTAPTESNVNVRILYFMKDDASKRFIEVNGVSGDRKIIRPIGLQGKTTNEGTVSFSFKMVSGQTSSAEIRANTVVNGKKTRDAFKNISTTEIQPKIQQPAQNTGTGGSTGIGGGISTGTPQPTQINYPECTVPAKKLTKVTSSTDGKTTTKTLTTGVASPLKGQCGDVTQCVASGGKAYSGFCPGTSSIQCCVPSVGTPTSGGIVTTGATWESLCFNPGETKSISLGSRGYTIEFDIDTTKAGTTQNIFNVKAGATVDESKKATAFDVCTLTTTTTAGTCGEVVIDNLKYDGATKFLGTVTIKDKETKTVTLSGVSHTVKYQDTSDKGIVNGQFTIDGKSCPIGGGSNGDCGDYTIKNLQYNGKEFTLEVYGKAAAGLYCVRVRQKSAVAPSTTTSSSPASGVNYIEKTLYSIDSRADKTIISHNGYHVEFRGLVTGALGGKYAKFLIWTPSTKAGDPASDEVWLDHDSYTGTYSDGIAIKAVSGLGLETEGPKKDSRKITVRITSKHDSDILKTRLNNNCNSITKANDMKDKYLKPGDCVWVNEFTWAQLKSSTLYISEFTIYINALKYPTVKVRSDGIGGIQTDISSKYIIKITPTKIGDDAFKGTITLENI